MTPTPSLPHSPLPSKPPGLRAIAIAAMAENRVIGRGGALPWNLPEDLKWFRENTRGRTLLMGRKTFASIGRPLPQRRTLVLTRSPDPIPGAETIRDLAQLPAVLRGADELWICGGAEIYTLTLPWWDELLLTRVKAQPEGDAFFPTFEERMELVEVVRETPGMRIERHRPRAG